MGSPDWPGFAEYLAGPFALSQVGDQRVCDAFVDTVACILAGAGTPAARAAAGQSRVFRWAVAAHALDYDDYDRPSVAHPSVVLVPVALNLAGNGRTAISAYAAGLEVMDRLGDMMNPAHYDRGWHATGTLGTVGAAAAAGRCLNLSAQQMGHALAIAASAAAGFKAQFGSAGKPIGVGFAALNGTLAAQLAAQGADGRFAALDAFVALYGPGTPGPLRFGDRPAVEEFGLVVKAHPCCGYLGRLVPGALALGAETTVETIAEIRLTLPPRNARVLSYGLPRNPDEARFSAPYCVATALLTGKLGLADFEPAALTRPDVLALARRITVHEASAQASPVDLSPEDPDVMEIRFADGRPPLVRVLADLPGSPEMPIARASLMAKLDECGGASAAPLLDDLRGLENLEPLRSLIENIK